MAEKGCSAVQPERLTAFHWGIPCTASTFVVRSALPERVELEQRPQRELGRDAQQQQRVQRQQRRPPGFGGIYRDQVDPAAAGPRKQRPTHQRKEYPVQRHTAEDKHIAPTPRSPQGPRGFCGVRRSPSRCRKRRSILIPSTNLKRLYNAYRASRRGKRWKNTVAKVEMNALEAIAVLQEELSTGTYRPGGYREFYVFEPKEKAHSDQLLQGQNRPTRLLRHHSLRTSSPGPSFLTTTARR